MNFKPRNILFQIHMWIGLSVGILFILLGLSGSIIVYDPELTKVLTPAAPMATTTGAPLPLARIVEAARTSAPQSRGQAATVALAQQRGDAVSVRFTAQRGFPGGGRGDGAGRGAPGGARGDVAGRGAGAARGPGGAAGRAGSGRGPAQDIFVDPVSGTVLGTRLVTQPTLLSIAHQTHEAMMLGQPGRTLVGYLGVGMFLLGLSGLVLWWPKGGQWKYAFGVRKTAKGFRLYREIHGMAGIWGYVFFLFVTFTGTLVAFPQVGQMLAPSTSAAPQGGPPGGPRQPDPVVTPVDGVQAISVEDAITLAQKSLPGATIRSVTIPARPTGAISVSAVSSNGPLSTVYVDPYRSQVIETRVQQAEGANSGGISWRLLHAGTGFGEIYRFILFLVGLLPLLFVTTGALMWFKKRQNRAAAE